MLVSRTNAAGQVCAPGDSGGPVFFIDGKTGAEGLLGIQTGGDFTCPNKSSVSINQCKATITNISSCMANMIPRGAVEEIVRSSWTASAPAELLNVGLELYSYMARDPSGESLVDMDVRRWWATTARAANEMCFNRGFVAGRMTGHQANGNFGLVCSTAGATWRDVNKADIANSQAAFTNVDVDGWAQARRAASNLCARAGKGYVGGHFNGHQVLGQNVFDAGQISRAGLICYGPPAMWFDAPSSSIEANHGPLGDLNGIAWAKADRAAADWCKTKGTLLAS